MEWQARLAEFNSASADHRRAEALLRVAKRNRRQSGCDSGLDLARHRATVTSRRLERATFRLTLGRPVWEVIWSLPDDA